MKTKRILIIGLTERMGGVETFIYNTTKFSSKEKYIYDYLIHGTDKAIFQEEICQFYGENPFYFFDSVKRKPFRTLKALFRFYKENKGKYDFIHLQTGATSELMYIFPFNFIFNIKVISHSHNGNGYSPIVNTIFRPLLNLMTYKRLSCSDEATKWLFGKRYLGTTIKVNNGIDVDRFTFKKEHRQAIREQYHISEHDFVVGHIGRFSEQKNHSKILEIFDQIIRKRPNAKLILVGVGENLEEIKQNVEKLHYKKSIIFAGKQIKTEEYYSAFDVFLMPSLYEGLPIVGVEAQSEGLQCFFSTNIDRDIILSNNAHLLSLNLDSSIWADRILKTPKVRNRENYSQIIDKANFSIGSTVKTLEEVYEVL